MCDKIIYLYYCSIIECKYVHTICNASLVLTMISILAAVRRRQQ